MRKFEKLNKLSVNIFELSFYLDLYIWKHKLKPTETSKNNSDRIVDLLFYKNHYALIKKINVLLGNHI